MSGVLVDSNVILDLFVDDPQWGGWAEQALADHGARRLLYINSIIYAEIAVAFRRVEALEAAVAQARLEMLDLPREALFLAGQAFLRHRRRGGPRAPLPDFVIGAQAAVLKLPLLTRDSGRYTTHFPTLRLLTP